MLHTHKLRTICFLIACAVLLLAMLPAVTGGRSVPSAAAAYIVLMVLPGLAIHIFLERRPRAVELALSGLVASPVVVAGAATLVMLAGMGAEAAAIRVMALGGILAVTASLLLNDIGLEPPFTRRNVIVLAGTVFVFGILAAALPITREWWRYYSDAWYHHALVLQIDTYGLPPEDPYFSGLAAQYMWFYHVLVLVLAKATGVDRGIVMALIAMQSLAGFGGAACLLSLRLRRRFAYGWFAVLTVILGLNALGWAFLPLKLIRALTGEVRGWGEIARTYAPLPFDVKTSIRLLHVYHNQTFLLNKFIVLTPLSLGLMFMAAFWYAAVRWLADGGRTMMTLAFFAAVGMLSFHPLVGFIMLAGTWSGLALLYLYRGRLDDLSPSRLWRLALCGAIALVVLLPYLYSVMHLKESEQLMPILISPDKSIGIIISCALVFILSAFQLPRLLKERSTATYFVIAVTLSLFLIGNLINLPGANRYDKPTFFIFYPLAIIGSWTFAERFVRRYASRRYRARNVLVALALLLPVNVFALAAYYNTPDRPRLSASEQEVARWVRKSTSRDALIVDSRERVFLIVPGPRRYFWGRNAFAVLFGYPKQEMERRRHARDMLYSNGALDYKALASLGQVENDLYVIVRENEKGLAGRDKFESYPDLFEIVHTTDTISVVKVDRRACRELALQLGKSEL